MAITWTDDYQHTDPWLGLSRLTTKTRITRGRIWDVLAVPKKYGHINAELDYRIRMVDEEKRAILKELDKIKAIKMSARKLFLRKIDNPVILRRHHQDNGITSKNVRVRFADDKLITLPVVRDRQREKLYYPYERDHKFYRSVIANTIDRCVDSSQSLIKSKYEQQSVGRTSSVLSKNKVVSKKLSHDLAGVLRSNSNHLKRNIKACSLEDNCRSTSTRRNISDCANDTSSFGIQTPELKKLLDKEMSTSQIVPENVGKMDKGSGGVVVQNSETESPGVGGQKQNAESRRGTKAAAAEDMSEMVKNASTADRYNPDGSIRTVHTMPDFAQSYGEARKARYIRSKEQTENERELSANEIFDKS